MRAPSNLRRQIVATSRALHQRGWVANHDGNVTARIAADRFVATPTATSKADVGESSLIEVDSSGKRVAGSARAFSELALHLAVYRAREDVGAVVHAHPPYATALACSGSSLLDRAFMAEAVVSLGARVPTLPFVAANADAARAVAAAAAEVDAVLCAHNGAFAWGRDLELAYLRLELVEHLAKIATLAEATGGVRALPASAVDALLEKRAKAGLGAAADRATGHQPRAVIACAPAPHADVRVVDSSESASRARLAATIRDELIRVLRESEQ